MLPSRAVDETGNDRRMGLLYGLASDVRARAPSRRTTKMHAEGVVSPTPVLALFERDVSEALELALFLRRRGVALHRLFHRVHDPENVIDDE